MISLTNMRRMSAVATAVALTASMMTASAAFAVNNAVGREDNRPVTPPVRAGIIKREGDAAGKDKQKDNAGGFCARITDILTKTDRELDGLSGKADTRHTEQTKKIEGNRDARDSIKQTNRLQRSAALSAHIAKLKALADTDAKKQAVTAYEQVITAALAAKQTAVDAATAAYRTAIDTMAAERQTVLQTTVGAFSGAVKSAEDKAKADCAANVADATVRTAFTQAIKVARQKLTIDRKAVEKGKSALSAATAAERSALKKADEDFRITVEAARKAVQVFFGDTVRKEKDTKSATSTNERDH